MSNTHICTNCVMPETAESLAFDDAGLCSVCHRDKVQKEGDHEGFGLDLYR